ncbi:MAG TPA: hypothetical protein VH308_13380 [Terracidiphilus sp.]|jgi:hypothetical protein|nr:hypothetical protein [Terracidiphilus sp.]
MTLHRSANARIPLFNLAGKVRQHLRRLRKARHFVFWMIVAAIPFPSPAEPTLAAVADFNSYIASVESRLSQQHRSPDTFVASAEQNEARLRQGELVIERLTPSHAEDLPGAMLHHWRGTAFAPGATTQDFERLIKNFNAYPQRFSPQVVTARVLSQQDDRYQAVMRVRQKHVIAVVMDTAYDITFGQLDPKHGYSNSRSTRISEIQSPGTDRERPLKPNEEHGFLWRLNTYWSYEQRDGGLYMQIESVSLTRSIPTGLGWAIGPFVQSVPRESLEFTLRSACNSLRKSSQ